MQSVGTPYSGTPVAGGLAGFAGIFGIACGRISDLTPAGAQSWQSGISASTRRNVFYYTTQVGSNEGNILLYIVYHDFWTFGVMIGFYVPL